MSNSTTIPAQKRSLKQISSMTKQLAKELGKPGAVDSDDVSQNALIRIVKQPDYEHKPYGWFKTVVLNAVKDAARFNEKHHKYLDYDQSPEQLSVSESPPESLHDLTSVPEMLASYSDLCPELMQAMLRLSPARREVLLLLANGYNHQEIAVITDADPRTVRSRIHYARKQARKLLKNFDWHNGRSKKK